MPGASPDTIAALVTAPLERQFGQIPSLSVMTSSSSFGISQITLQFDLGRDIDGAAQDVQAAINAAGSTLAARAALSADLRQGEPGGCAGADAGAHLADHFAPQSQRSRRHPDGAAAGRGRRRRPRLDPGRHPARGAHPGRSVAARRLRHRARRHPPGHRRRQRLGLEGLARRRASVLHHLGQRSVDRRRVLQGAGGGLSQRRAGAADRRRPGRRRAGERQGRRLVSGHAGRGDRHPAPARRQRHRDGRAGEGASCRGCSAPCRSASR